MHFFNPVHVMKLVEVVRHASVERGCGRARGRARRALGKTPITVTDSPGFASSRLGVVIGLEAMRMVEQGVASAADIDTAMKLGYGHPMGPLELTDLVGLDVRLGIAEYLRAALGDGVRAAAAAARQGRGRQARQEDRRGLLPLVRRRQAALTARQLAGGATLIRTGCAVPNRRITPAPPPPPPPAAVARTTSLPPVAPSVRTAPDDVDPDAPSPPLPPPNVLFAPPLPAVSGRDRDQARVPVVAGVRALAAAAAVREHGGLVVERDRRCVEHDHAARAAATSAALVRRIVDAARAARARRIDHAAAVDVDQHARRDHHRAAAAAAGGAERARAARAAAAQLGRRVERVRRGAVAAVTAVAAVAALAAEAAARAAAAAGGAIRRGGGRVARADVVAAAGGGLGARHVERAGDVDRPGRHQDQRRGRRAQRAGLQHGESSCRRSRRRAASAASCSSRTWSRRASPR